MQDKHTIQTLLNSSEGDDMAYLPLFVHGKFFKRISKEEIQGWTATHPTHSFQKQYPPNKVANAKTRRAVPKPIPQNFETLQSINTLTSIKANQNEAEDDSANTTGGLFKVFQHLPQISLTGGTKQEELAEQKERVGIDFIKGTKIRFPAKRIRAGRSLCETVSENHSFAVRRGESLPLGRMQLERSFNTKRHNNREKTTSVEIISYPLQTFTPYVVREETNNRIGLYLREYQRAKSNK